MTQVSEPAINIIIPNWNGKHLLGECLGSIQKQTYHDFTVTIVDNGSNDGSVDFIRKHFPEVCCISLPINSGFSCAVNIGIKNNTSPYILLLNNDIELAPDCLQQLTINVQKRQAFDFFSPKMINYHSRDLIDGAGDGVLRGGVGYRYGTMEKDGGIYDQDGEVFGACGGAALYKKSFFETVGLFDEDFFAYLEDVDINLRARRLGLRCYYIPSAIVYHIGSATTGSKINEMTVKLSTKNNINIIVKNYPAALFFKFLPVIIIYQFFWLLFILKKRKFLAYIKGLINGIAQIKKMSMKKAEISRNQQITNSEFAELIKQSEYLVIQSIMARRAAAEKSNFLFKGYQKLFF